MGPPPPPQKSKRPRKYSSNSSNNERLQMKMHISPNSFGNVTPEKKTKQKNIIDTNNYSQNGQLKYIVVPKGVSLIRRVHDINDKKRKPELKWFFYDSKNHVANTGKKSYGPYLMEYITKKDLKLLLISNKTTLNKIKSNVDKENMKKLLKEAFPIVDGKISRTSEFDKNRKIGMYLKNKYSKMEYDGYIATKLGVLDPEILLFDVENKINNGSQLYNIELHGFSI